MDIPFGVCAFIVVLCASIFVLCVLPAGSVVIPSSTVVIPVGSIVILAQAHRHPRARGDPRVFLFHYRGTEDTEGSGEIICR